MTFKANRGIHTVEFSVGQQPSTYKALRFINCYYNTEKKKYSKKECAGVLPVPSEASPLMSQRKECSDFTQHYVPMSLGAGLENC